MSFIRILIAMSAVALTAGCSSDFSGGEAGFGGGATAKKTPSKEDPLTVECDSKIQACSNGKPVDPGTYVISAGARYISWRCCGAKCPECILQW